MIKSNLFSAILTTFAYLMLGCTPLLAGNVPTEMPGLLNFHEVHPYLYRGGAPDDAALKNLKEKGIKTVIDLRAPSEDHNSERKKVIGLGMTYINLPMASKAPTKKQLHTFIDEVEKAQKSESGPVFLHCAHGSDRTGCLVGIWRVTHEGWSYDQAYAEMRKYFFTPKFVNLSGAVREAAPHENAAPAQTPAAPSQPTPTQPTPHPTTAK